MPAHALQGNINMRDGILEDPEVEKRPQKIPKTILITGANRGIGLGLVTHFLKFSEVELLIATCRNVEKAEELRKLAENQEKLKILELEVDDDDSIQKTFEKTNEILNGKGLNLLINNAGIFLNYEVDGPISRKTMMKQLETNSVSPAIMTQTFLPLLKKASGSFEGSDEISTRRSAVVNISSTMASIEMNNGCFDGPLAAYRMSKSALNAFSRQSYMELSKYSILSVSLCPGWVRTDMGGANADLDLLQATEVLAGNIFRLDERNNGLYFDRFLYPIPN